jgi:beta-glucosidase
MASKMGEAYISGHQGQDLKNRTKAAVCLKHYMGYSYPFNGLDRTNAYIPDVLLREKFLPTFAQGVATGALSVMVNSANVNGIPGHMNSYYLNDILKGELQFQGFAVSDWQDIIRLHTRDMVAETPEDAVRIAVMAGLDMSMVSIIKIVITHILI